jgi:hypothetical protein
MNFFIFSLPRSGSAWLSVFLTYDGCFCYHEPTSEKECLDYLFERPGIVGGVDTLAYTRPEIRFKFRSFALRRDYYQIESSSRSCGVHYKAPAKQFEAATKALPTIDYHKLDQIEYLEKVWHTIVGTPFDRERALMLIEMNVQRNLDRFKRKVASLAYIHDPAPRVRCDTNTVGT